MKLKNICLLLAAILIGSLTSCAGNKEKNNTEMAKKTIVVYFSATGTTKAVAEKIAEITGVRSVAIEPVEPYSAADLDWNDKQSRSSVEMNDDNLRPAVKPVDVNWAEYDTILLGYPIWWDLAPRAVNTFIDNNNLNGKTVIPFATSGGSGIEHSVSVLRKSYPDIDWSDGRLLNHASDKSIRDWISSF